MIFLCQQQTQPSFTKEKAAQSNHSGSIEPHAKLSVFIMVYELFACFHVFGGSIKPFLFFPKSSNFLARHLFSPLFMRFYELN